MDKILKPHIEATIERIKKEKVVLAVQDSTTLNYTAHPLTEGLGPIRERKKGQVYILDRFFSLNIMILK